jgi:hypothetical protein
MHGVDGLWQGFGATISPCFAEHYRGRHVVQWIFQRGVEAYLSGYGWMDSEAVMSSSASGIGSSFCIITSKSHGDTHQSFLSQSKFSMHLFLRTSGRYRVPSCVRVFCFGTSWISQHFLSASF